MFFVLSKVLAFLAQPLAIIVMLLVASWIVRNERWKKILRRTSLALFLFTSNFFIANEVVGMWEIPVTRFSDLPAKYDYAVLLTGVTRTEMTPKDRVYFSRGADRATHTLQLYKEGHVRKVIISGGSGRLNGTGVREADDLADFLMLAGVPKEDILIENVSKNTRESAIEVKKMLNSLEGNERIILVTSGYHMRRAMACFNKEGIDVDHFAVDPLGDARKWNPEVLLVPRVDAIIMWQVMIREWVGFAAYKIMGYI